MKRRFFLSTLLAAGLLMLTGCFPMHAGPVPVQEITEWEAGQLGAQSMNQIESWEPNVEYATQRDGRFWKVYGYKTRGKNPITGEVTYEPGVYRVITLSQYGKVTDFWRVQPK